MLESSQREEIQRYCQRKFLSMVISRGMSFSMVLCYWCKTRRVLRENCPAITPTQTVSSMSFNEQSDTPSQNQNPIQTGPSAEILPCVESLQPPCAPTKDMAGRDHSEEASDSDLDSVSESKSCSDSCSQRESGSRSVAFLGESHLRRKPYLRILKIRPVWEGLLHMCHIQLDV